MGQKRNQREIKKYIETNEKGNKTYQNLWNATKGFSKRQIHSYKCLHKETRN